MSELKAFESERIYWAVEQVEREAGDIDSLHLDDNLFYIKSEADKVIADLEESHKMEVEQLLIEIVKLKQKNDDSRYTIAVLRKEKSHHKYKRCLAMAKWCRMHDEFTQLESERLGLPQRTLFLEYRRKAMWWNKWYKRWLELAEKFNSNSTLQQKDYK